MCARIVLVAALALACCTAARAVAAEEDWSLPSVRPPLWPFRTYNDAYSWDCSFKDNKVLWLTVEHKEIPGVTAEMMHWLYSGGIAGSSPHPVTKKVFPNFLLMHPRDHAFHGNTGVPFEEKKTHLKFVEFPLTGCKATGDRLAPYTCPKGANTGFTTASNPAQVAAADRTNATSVPLKISDSGFETGVEGCNDRENCAYVVKTRQNWKDTPTGLKLRTEQQFGLDTLLALKVNPRVVAAWAGGEDPLDKCSRQVLHFIEEMGALQFWLPQAFKSSSSIHAASVKGGGRLRGMLG